MQITVYQKSGCPWAAEVVDYLNSLNLQHEIRDILVNPRFAREVIEKTGQSKSPTLEIDGEFVLDAGVEDVAHVLEKKGVSV